MKEEKVFVDISASVWLQPEEISVKDNWHKRQTNLKHLNTFCPTTCVECDVTVQTEVGQDRILQVSTLWVPSAAQHSAMATLTAVTLEVRSSQSDLQSHMPCPAQGLLGHCSEWETGWAPTAPGTPRERPRWSELGINQ